MSSSTPSAGLPIASLEAAKPAEPAVGAGPTSGRGDPSPSSTSTSTSIPSSTGRASVARSTPRQLPGPRGLALWQAGVRFRRAPIPTLEAAIARWGDASAYPFARMPLVLLNHPDQVAHVLVDGAGRYGRSPNYRELELVIGKGLLTNDGASWRRQRRIAQPAFHRRALAAQLGPHVLRATDDMLLDWRARAAKSFDVARDTHRLALRVAGLALFSRDLGGAADELAAALEVALPFVQRRTESLIRPPLRLPLPSHLRFRRASGCLDRIVATLIEDRRAELRATSRPSGSGAGDHDDLLGRLLTARDPETGEAMSDRQLRDEVTTFLLAGHETSANALAWTLHELSHHPEIAQALEAEVDRVLGDRPPTPEDLPRLDLARRVVREALRLHPPAWAMERLALEDDVVDGYLVPRGSMVLLCPWTTHRHRDVWREPERFDPERWHAPPRQRGAYFPFGGGTRQCIGEDFALLELELATARIAQVARLAPLPGHEVRPAAGVTLRPANGVQVRARWRR
jgi:cytochrome P450